ncbi:hypothetical protein FGO68_gene13285 [Halteria grandinella]|uniref:C3H1-type domain-containing protein n=1 Tax=Halteria grandinella TaxID=5974 RepID=A0A8J8P1L7_HALGN|nr:hypothetical protein FGO68_gene13285 [Halteria grandinella]
MPRGMLINKFIGKPKKVGPKIRVTKEELEKTTAQIQNLVQFLSDFNQEKIADLVQYAGGEVLNEGSKDQILLLKSQVIHQLIFKPTMDDLDNEMDTLGESKAIYLEEIKQAINVTKSSISSLNQTSLTDQKLSQSSRQYTGRKKQPKQQQRVLKLEKWLDILFKMRMLLKTEDTERELCKFYIVKSKDQANFQQKFGVKKRLMATATDTYEMGVQMFEVDHVFKNLMEKGVQSLIVTSGTLSPMEQYVREIGLEFKYKLQGEHVIDRENLMLASLSGNGQASFEISSNAMKRDPSMVDQIGRALQEIVLKVTNGGVLVFFQAYYKMDEWLKKWKASGLFTKALGSRKVFSESRNQRESQEMLEEFRKINSKGIEGAVFFAVCRGKMSEGLDFADSDARCVIIIGIPYLDFSEPYVMIKKSHFDKLNELNPALYPNNGSDWYTIDAMKAVNQSIGRTIRHKNDFGTAIVIDSRISQERFKGKLSLWLRDRLTWFNKLNLLTDNLEAFSIHMKKKYSEMKRVREEYSLVSEEKCNSDEEEEKYESQELQQESDCSGKKSVEDFYKVNATNSQQSFKKGVCFNFQKGRCYRGANCIYKHEESNYQQSSRTQIKSRMYHSFQ